MICSELLSRAHFASRAIVGVTRTKTRHESIRRSVLRHDVDGADDVEKEGSRFRLMTLDEVLATTAATTCGSRPRRHYKDVVFCAPPSGFDDYASGITEVATRLWSAATPQQRGSFVFTSSGVVYGDGSGGVAEEDGTTAAITIVNESSPTVVDMEQRTITTMTKSSDDGSSSSGSGGSSSGSNSNAKSSATNSSSNDGSKNNPRALRMLHAENAVLSMGGCALRLAGLYSLDRGAHNYWLEKFGGSSSSSSSSTTNNDDNNNYEIPGTVPSRGDGIINLLHYEDAASAVISALMVGPNVNSRRVFLISDGHPLTRKQICTNARQHVRYDGFGMPLFIDDDDVVVKTTDGGVGKGKVYDGRKSNDALQWKPKYPSFDEFMTSKTT